ncbi:MAG TPA: hypothetical protein VHT02_03805 [Methylocella sp.]|nr:hypothetical protein [Methylocella sp.]
MIFVEDLPRNAIGGDRHHGSEKNSLLAKGEVFEKRAISSILGLMRLCGRLLLVGTSVLSHAVWLQRFSHRVERYGMSDLSITGGKGIRSFLSVIPI